MDMKKFKRVSFIIFIVACIVLTVFLIPMIMSFNDPKVLKSFVESFGAFGIVILFLIQVFQVVVALIPGELTEFVSGTMYGWLGGFLICISGVAAGQSIVYYIVKVWGEDFVKSVTGSEKFKKLKFLRNEKNIKRLTFLLYFIPGTPKDVITYFMPLTGIKFKDFMIISLVARIFSICSSTYAGDSFAQKDFLRLVIVYGTVIVLSVGGLFIYKYSEEKYGRKHKDNIK